jgi:hypothetical protein
VATLGLMPQLGVSYDNAYLGSERNSGKPGHSPENRQPLLIVVGINENLEHPTYAVIEPMRSFDNACVLSWGRRRLTPRPRSTATGWPASHA